MEDERMRRRMSVIAVLVAVFVMINSVAVNAIVGPPTGPGVGPYPGPTSDLVIVTDTQVGAILNVTYELSPIGVSNGVEILNVQTIINGHSFAGNIINLDVTTLGITPGTTVQSSYLISLQQHDLVEIYDEIGPIDGPEGGQEPEGLLEPNTQPILVPVTYLLPAVTGSFDVRNPQNLWITADDRAQVFVDGSSFTNVAGWAAPSIYYVDANEVPFFAAKAEDTSGQHNIAGFRLEFADTFGSLGTNTSWYVYNVIDEETGQSAVPPVVDGKYWYQKDYVADENWIPASLALTETTWATDGDFPAPIASSWIWTAHNDVPSDIGHIDTPVYFRSVRPLRHVDVTVEAEGYTANVTVDDVFPTVTVVEGDVVDLFAPVVESHNFLGWFDGASLVTSAYEDDVQVLTNKTFTAKYELKSFVVTATADPVAGGNPAVISSPVEYDGSVQLKANKAGNYNFVKWTLDGNEYATSKNITVTNIREDLDFVAHYAIKRFTIEVISTDGGSASLELPLVGDPVGTPSEVTADHNTMITMTASEPDLGYRFVGWYRVDGNKNDFKTSNYVLERRTNQNKVFEARYVELDRYAISGRYNSENIALYGLGTNFIDGTSNSVQVMTLNPFTMIDEVRIYKVVEGVETLILTDDSVYNGDSFLIEDPLDLEELADYVVEVDSTTYYNVYAFSENEDEGTVAPEEQMVIDLPENSEFATVTATPTPGNRFLGWYVEGKRDSEDSDQEFGPTALLDPAYFTELVSTDPEYTFEVFGPVTIMGLFGPIPVDPPAQYTLTVNVVGNGTVPGFTGTNTFSSGTNVNLEAVIGDPELTEFAGWSGAITASDLEVVVTVNGNIEVTATFEDIIEDEDIPEDTPDEPEEEILDEELPESAPGEDIPDEPLPETGGVPASAMAIFGIAMTGLGFKIRKKK
jgi:LPXTG-motif cell wall-anchored protein